MTATQLAEIENRLTADRDDFASGYSDQSTRDRTHLLGLVKAQQDQLDRVLELAYWAGKRGWQIAPATLRNTINEASK